MSTVVTYTVHGRTGVITVDYPPVNALGHAVRLGLVAALEQGLADDSTDILVLTTASRTFIAGADIREFGKPSEAPVLPDVIARYDGATKPVVAALYGTALGGGLEVALACHFRAALTGTRVGLPEIKLGLLPGSGGTQRLPRLIGPAAALDIILSGDPLNADRALELGIIDAVIDAPTALDAGLAFATRIRNENLQAIPISARSERLAEVDETFFAERRAELQRRLPHLHSPHRCVDAVEAAVRLPFDQGMLREREIFLECMASPQRAGLIHAFFGERKAAKVPGLGPDIRPRPVESMAVIGAGTMGGGIAMCFANVGIPVTLLEAEATALERGVAAIRRIWEASAAKGKLTQADVEKRMSLITPTLSYEDLGQVDLVIEAVFENMAVKKEIFGKLDRVCRPGAILATNTSTLDINEIARSTSRPQDVVGMHFFSPANVMRLLENVRAEATADDVVATVMAVGARIGKVCALVGVCYGFVGNRMLHQRGREATALVEEGASPEQVDRVLTTFGFPMGPFAMGDLAGIDVGWRIREGLRQSGAADAPVVNWTDRLAEQGRFGQKTGAGIYRYEPGSRKPIPDQVTADLIAGDRAAKGITPRDIGDAEILERTLYVMINEGARILDEGIAARSVDIDVIWIHGYGFPAWRGGPMFWADQLGLPVILDAIRQIHSETGAAHWAPSPLLERLVAGGKGFGDL